MVQLPVLLLQRIHDEYDANEEADITALNEKEYLVNGSMNLYDMCEKLGIHLESEDYDSIGGYILEHLDHLPDEGESITTENGILLRVEKMDKNRIEKVYLKTPQGVFDIPFFFYHQSSAYGI